MQSKILWFKKGIFLQDLRSVGWIGLLYFITLLFMLPLQLVMMHENDSFPYRYVEYNSLFAVLEGFQFFLMFTIPVILGVALLRYLHVKGSADFIHSLPIKRKSLFNHHVVMGILLLVIPIIITAVVTGIVHSLLDLQGFFQIIDIWKWTGITILLYIFVFMLTVLIGTVTGISAAQVVLTYILLLFPTGILMLLSFNVKYFVYGFAHDYHFDRNIEYLTPIIRSTQIPQNGMSNLEIIVYLALIAGFYLLALFAYKKRHIEGATQAISFPLLKPVFKYGVTFCFMLLAGMYFGETQRGDFSWLIFGYFFGSILGYILAEMVLQKTWRVFKNVKGYFGYVVVTICLGVLLHLDITGYEKKLPNLSNVERAYFGDHVYNFEVDENNHTSIAMPHHTLEEVLYQSNVNFLSEEQNIQHVLMYHEQIIKDRKHVDVSKGYYRNISIGYELQNGDKLIRQYRIAEGDYKEFVAPIYESQEYKYSHNELLRLKETITIDKIRIASHTVLPKHYETTDSAEIEAIINIIKEDMLLESYEEMMTQKEPWGDIELLLENNQRLYIPWKKSYAQFDQWLRDQELLEKVRVVADEIDYALVIKNEQGLEAHHKSEQETIVYFESVENKLKVDNSDQLEHLLQETTWNTNEEYLVSFYSGTTDIPIVKGLVTAPDFVKEQFE